MMTQWTCPDHLKFGVEKAKIKWGSYLQDAIRSRGSASSQFQSYSGAGPSVVAQNSRGDKRVVEVVKSTKEARERVIAIEKDFVSLGVEQWCERYRGTDVFCKWLTSTPGA